MDWLVPLLVGVLTGTAVATSVVLGRALLAWTRLTTAQAQVAAIQLETARQMVKVQEDLEQAASALQWAALNGARTEKVH